MPLLFQNFCDLLTQLDSFSSRQPPLTHARCELSYQQAITQWFRMYDVSVNSTHVDAIIVLSALLPARRTDRVYSLKAPSLSRKLRRYLRLGKGRWQQLDQWQLPGRGDLGDCVERLQAQTEVPVPLPGNEITLEDVDRTLEGIAKACRFSAPSVKGGESLATYQGVDNALERIYHRLQSREAKWFTRMILKDYCGLELRDGMVLRCLDSRLPAMMKNQDSFQSAVDSLRNPGKCKDVIGPVPETTEVVRDVVGPTPKIRVKVARTTYLKGRSIKHALSMIDGRAMSAERKYDGEYFQIHIDLTKDQKWIQVFSKSGKDSTRDRERIHGIVKDSLRIGRKDCRFSRNCILEGEMVIWSDEASQILEFHKIRKHVSRTGSFLGTKFDSPTHDTEHLMLIYYDIMLMDDDPVLKMPHTWRRALLEKVARPVQGRAKLATRKEIQFKSPNGPKRLLELLAQAFVNGWEGIVLKPSNEPYFNDYNDQPSHKFASCWIKLKKDYIAGLGDTADFAVFGAGYSNVEAVKLGNSNVKWTHFHLGCLKNKDDVKAKGARPKIDVFVAISQCIRVEDVKMLNQRGQFQVMTPDSKEADETFELVIKPGVPKMSVVFKKPFVFEVLGSGFDKAPNQGFFTLRFPRVLKVHWDRDWKDAVTFDELQQMAKEARMAPSGDITADVRNWIEKLKKADRGIFGHMASWEDSQEELSIEENSAPTIPQRKQTLAATPLVRRDTGEMILEDSRSSNGEILEQRNPRHAQITYENGKSLVALPCPSPSQQLMNELNSAEGPTVGQSSIHPKRTAEIEDAESARAAKKRKPAPSSQSTTEDATSGSDDNSKPLQHITNCARPREVPTIKSPKTSMQPDFSLVPKLKASTYYRPSSRARRSVEDSSSQRTTERCSESTPRSGVTSQNDSTQSQSLEQHTPTQRPTNTSLLPEHNTPTQRDYRPLTTNSISPPKRLIIQTLPPEHNPQAPRNATPPPPPKPPIQLPNLTQSGVILCPCIANTPYIYETLLMGPHNKIPSSRFPSSLTLPPAPSPDIPPPFSKHPIVLVESNREAATVDLMERLVCTMAKSGFEEVQLWDWRVLEGVRKLEKYSEMGGGAGDGGGGVRFKGGLDEYGGVEGYRAKVVKKRFFARIAWVGKNGDAEGEGEGVGKDEEGEGKDEEGEGKDGDGEGGMRVEWGDGNVTVVPRK